MPKIIEPPSTVGRSMGPGPRPRGRGRSFRAALERLEGRLLLSKFHWNGSDGTEWSDGSNWDEGEAPSEGSELDFKDQVSQVFPHNDSLTNIKKSRSSNPIPSPGTRFSSGLMASRWKVRAFRRWSSAS